MFDTSRNLSLTQDTIGRWALKPVPSQLMPETLPIHMGCFHFCVISKIADTIMVLEACSKVVVQKDTFSV